MKSKEELWGFLVKTEQDRREYLKGLFEFVPDTVIRELAYEEVEKDQYILRAGMPCNMVYVILSGQIAGVDHQKAGRAYYFMDFTKMHIVGDFEIFGDFPEYCVSIYASKECKLLRLSAKSYLRWIRHDENAMFLRLKNIMSTLTSERMDDREHMLMGCKERLIVYLVKSYENGKKDRLGKCRINRTQAELADRVGFNVRSVQRSIAALEKEHLVSTENGKITISQEQYLQLTQYKD